MWTTPPDHLFAHKPKPPAEPTKDQRPALRIIVASVSLIVVLAIMVSAFSKSRYVLSLFKNEVPSVTEVWSKFGTGFSRAETFLISGELLASLYLVEKEFDLRSEMIKDDLTYQALFAKAEIPSLFQRGSLDFLSRTEVCAYNGKLFASAPHPCQRLRPLHRSLHQMSAYLTLTVEQLIKQVPSEKLVDLSRKQTVAMMVYFCGAKEAALYIYRGYKAPQSLECSGLPMGVVMRRVKSYQKAFERAQSLQSV